MKLIHIVRMEKLIAFLEELEPAKFDFADVLRKDHCGTVGCSIGWTSTVFPELVTVRLLPSQGV